MYLMPAREVGNRKWNRGRVGYYLSPRGIARPPQKRMGELGRYRSLGQSEDVPAGSTLNYRVSYGATSTSLNPFSQTFAGNVTGIINVVQQCLQSNWKIQVTASDYSADISGLTYTVTLSLQTMGDYGSVADIKSVVDGCFYNQGGIRQLTSNITPVNLAPPGSPVTIENIGPAVPTPGTPTSQISWWDQASVWGIQNKLLVGAGGALFLYLLLRR